MSTLALCSIRRVSRIVIGAVIQAPGDASAAIVDAGRDLLLATVNGASPATLIAEKSAAHIVAGAIEAAEQAGADTPIVIRSIVHGTIKGAWESGADIGPVAVKSISAAIQVAEHIGIDPDAAINSAVDGVIGVGDQIGVKAGGWIFDALKKSMQSEQKWHQESFGMTERNEQDCLR